MAHHHFTREQKEFIKDHVKNRGNTELTKIFNMHFNLSLAVNQIKCYKKNHNLSSGLDGRFKPGIVPFNKGKKGLSSGGVETQFKKGHKPYNYKPVGAERVNAYDYVDVKIQDGKQQKNWKGKHILIWEKYNGPVPKGNVVIFGDGNRRNFDINNLILVSRKQLATLNKLHLIQNDAELTKTGVIIADIYQKIGERKKRRHVSAN